MQRIDRLFWTIKDLQISPSTGPYTAATNKFRSDWRLLPDELDRLMAKADISDIKQFNLPCKTFSDKRKALLRIKELSGI